MQYDAATTAAFVQARTLFQQRKFADAAALAGSLAEAHPDAAGLAAFAAEANQANGDLPAALEWIDRAIAGSDEPQYLVKKAWLLSQSMRRDAIPDLVPGIRHHAEQEEGGLLFWQLGKLHYLHNRLPEAAEAYERALERAGDRPDWLYDLATARFYLGDAARAEEALERLLELDPQAGPALYLRAVLRRQGPDDNHVDDLRRRLRTGFRRQENEAAALYALAKELEDLGEDGQSFDALAEGAKKKREGAGYDRSAVIPVMHDITRHFGVDALASSGGHDEEGAVFIVGMPRTGTTLVQRLLLQSKELEDAGELTDFGYLLASAVAGVRATDPAIPPGIAAQRIDFEALGRKYMQGARQMAGGSRRFIDKMPVNFLYCGMIHKALPRAKIIHLVRDPLDSCYAIYKTLFFKAYEFSYDQEELAEYYGAYVQLMRHWHAVMPGRILDVRYEDLVTDPESQARRMYEWCGLSWNQDVLAVPDDRAAFATASSAQVREPIHTRSIGRSRRHADRLEPLVRGLARHGVLDAAARGTA